MNRHLPARLVLAGIPLLALSLFVACGDDIENTTINQTGVELFDSSEDLPECTDKNESDLVFVRGETSARICVDGEWIALSSDGSDVDFSCKTVELKDKSGLKIVCNGDSVGVVLNGSDGKDGKDAEVAKPDTTVNDSEKVAVSLDSLVGVTQKGPFLKGSTVYLYELSDGRTLKQTNGNFTSNITSDDGRYKFTARDLVSQYAMVVVDGYYRNEVTGGTSDAPIRLKAITDMRKRSSVNVNILTQLEFDRVYSLVTRGDKDGKKLTVKQAKRQAQKEILKLFDIELDDDTDAEDMDVFGKTDADAALLAISVLLQGDAGAIDLSVILTEISNALAETGEWNDSVAKARFADWALKADTENRLAQFRKNVADWHLGDNVPDFEKFVRKYVGIESGIGVCGSDKAPVGTFVHVPNKKSGYYAQAYDSIDASKNSLARLICDGEGGNHWRIATALERDTKGWSRDTADGVVRKGQIDTSLTYVLENGMWRHGTDLDSVVGFGCSQEMAAKDSVFKASDEIWYKCADTSISVEGINVTSAWHVMSDFEKDLIYWNSNKNTAAGTLLKGEITGKTMVWDADTLREASDNEILLKKACVTSMYGKRDSLSNTLTYTCDKTGWSKTGTFADKRVWPYPTYKGVQIGDQVWMAENLNYAYTGIPYKYSIGDNVYTSDSTSWCYDDNPANCDKYGRLYLWSAAMDSVAQFSDKAKGCGRIATCSPTYPVRGVCPENWHLPTKEEFETLLEAVGGIDAAARFLKSQTGWGGNGDGLDAFGFAALPAGPRSPDGAFYNGDGLSYFWSSTGINTGDAYFMYLLFDNERAFLSNNNKDNAFSVRCVHD